MASFLVGSFAFNMATWDLSDIAGGTVTSDGASEVDVTGASNRFVYTITGSGFTTFDTNGFPTDGTVTGVTMAVPGKAPMTIAGVSISATDFMGFVNTHDTAGLETAIFSGNDTFVGRAGNDTLLGFGGNDTFSLGKGGNDTANGGDGDDKFNFVGAFTAADSVDGGTGNDRVILDGNYAAGVTFGATTMTNVETITLVTGHSYKLILDAATVTSGERMVVNGTTITQSNSMYVDGSAVTGDLRLAAGAGQNTLIGGSGNDYLSGGAAPFTTTFNIAAGGNDAVLGGTGNDEIFAGGALNSSDNINGGAGSNALDLNGNYSAGLVLASTFIKNANTLVVEAGHNYVLSVDANQTLDVVSAAGLGAGDSLHFDGSANTIQFVDSNGYNITAGAGDDVLIGTLRSNATNTFHLEEGGNDTVTGPGLFDMGSGLNAGDKLDGVTGTSRMTLDGNYATTVTFNNDTFVNMGFFDTLNDGSDAYSFVEADGNVAAGKTLIIQAAGTSFSWDGSAETNGAFSFTVIAQTVNLTGGAGNDTFDVPLSHFSLSDRFNGGAGNDTILFDAQDATVGNTHLNAANLTSIETIQVANGARIITTDANFTGGQVINVHVSGSHHPSLFDGAAETDSTFNASGSGTVEGGHGNDTIFIQGGVLIGNGGADMLSGDGFGTDANHRDVFGYSAVSDSTSTAYDTVANFSQTFDTFAMNVAVSAVDAQVATGALSMASFDADLAAAVGAAQLGAGHAVVFTPDSGTLAGDHFLIVDANGTAGYQAGADYVMLLVQATSLSLTAANFTT